MDDAYDKETLSRYLGSQQSALLSKLDGVSEYDVRRPHVRTGTNLLGIVKHVAHVQLGYLGDSFDRPAGIPKPWDVHPDDPDADLWARPQESRAEIMELFELSRSHGEATIRELDLDTQGTVAWWPEERRHPTLRRVLVHLIVDVTRHAGHADILRELIDGAAGYLPGNSNLADRTDAGWAEHFARVEAAAAEFR